MYMDLNLFVTVRAYSRHTLALLTFILGLFRPMGLPSAGFLPFVQTMMCELSAKPSQYSSDMPIFPNAKYVTVYVCSYTTHSVSHLYNLLDENFIENFATDYCTSLQTLQGQVNCHGYNLNGK